MAQHIDANRIQQLGATTAWDVLRAIAPVQSRDLRSMPTRRSATSVGSGITGVTAPRIIVDGVPLVDPGLLRTMPAADVIAIDLVGPLDAVTLFGQSYGGGAIVIRTRHETAPRGG